MRSLDPNVKMNPPLRAAEDRAALVEALRDGTIEAIATDHAPHARHEKEVPVRGGAVRRHRARDRLRGALHAARRAGRRPARDAARAHERRARPASTASTPPRIAVGAPANLVAPRPRGRLARGRGLLPVEVRELVAPRLEAPRPGRADGRGREGRSTRHERLPRPRGRHGLPRPLGRRARGRVRRGRLHDGDDRLPGGRHRPELRRAARRLHGADGRELRRLAAAVGVDAPARARGADAPGGRERLDAVAPRRRGSSRSTEIDTRSLVLRLRERGRDARGRGRRARPRSSRCSRDVRAQPPMAGRALVAGVSTPEPVLRRAAAPCASPSSTTAASARSSTAWLRPGAAVTVFPHTSDAETVLAARPDGVLLSNGPGDPAALAAEVDRRARAARARADPRHLPRATSCSRWPPASRRSSCRSATAARTIRCSSWPPAACSSRARTTVSPSAATGPARDARLALRRHRRGDRAPGRACALGPVPPGGGPGPARRLAGDRGLGRGDRLCRRRPDLESICVIGAGPIVIGQACEFDYSGQPGAQGAARGGLPDDRRQLEPGDDHDRPRLRRPDLPRAARRRGRHATCSSASGPDALLPDARRPDGAQPRAPPRGGGRPRGARRRADRRRATRRSAAPRTAGSSARRWSASACASPSRSVVTSLDELPEALSFPVILRPAFTLGGHGGGIARDAGRARAAGWSAGCREPGRPGARRGVARRLGRVRARGDARREGQRRRRLLDREPRPDGRPHGRLRHGRAADDALRRGLPGAPRRRRARHPRRRASRPAARTSSSRASAGAASCA